MRYRWFTANRCEDPCGCKWELHQAIYPGGPAVWVATFACPDHPFDPDDIAIAQAVTRLGDDLRQPA